MNLKSCPFCGAFPSVQFSFGAWEIACMCGISILGACGIGDDYEPSKQKAIDKWNRRVPVSENAQCKAPE